jgi:hypothetical protein
MSIDNQFIRSPGFNPALTDQQITEYAKCADPETGYKYFMLNYFYIQHPTKGQLLYEPFDFQVGLIDNYHSNRFSVSMMPRQTGKCFSFGAVIHIKNNKTGKQYAIPIGTYYEWAIATRDNTQAPDISNFVIDNQPPHSIQNSVNSPEISTNKLSDCLDRKFTNIVSLTDWSIATDTGWHALVDIKQTIPYEVWSLELENGMKTQCADDHIVFDVDMNQQFVKDLKPGQLIQTVGGPTAVLSITPLHYQENMYDVEVDSPEHRYYGDGILSHNTTSAAGYLLWFAMFVPDSTILIAAHQYSGAQEIMHRVRYAYEMCPMWLKAGVEVYNQGNIDFDNKSRIVARATTEKTGRGMSLSLLYLDEFAFVRPTWAKEFWTAISPTLSTGGKCIITSTPNSDEDQFAQIWKQANKKVDSYGNPTKVGVNGFSPFMAHWSEHPDRDEAWKEAEIGRIGEERFRREHGLEFITAEETLIHPSALLELASDEPIERQGQVRWFSKPKKDSSYLIGLDPSLGTGGDPAAIQVFELPSLKQVAEWQHNMTPVQKQVHILRDICGYIYETVGNDSQIIYSVENNTLGEAALVEISHIGENNIHGIFMTEPRSMGGGKSNRKGFTTSSKTKIAACSKLKHYIEKKKMKISSANLIKELKNFIAHGTSYAAKAGETDDLVMATILIVRMLAVMKDYDASVDEILRDEADFLLPMPFIMI